MILRRNWSALRICITQTKMLDSQRAGWVRMLTIQRKKCQWQRVFWAK